MHIRALLILAVLTGVLATQHELLPYNPVANSKAVVVAGNARFTVLTPSLIRMEYSPDGKFEDRATLAFVNRNTPVPSFSQKTTGSTLTITTSTVQLSYTVNATFSETTLSAKGVSSAPNSFQSWHYGQQDPQNLLGTIKSLDLLGPVSLNCTQIANMSVHDESLHCEWGLVSRSGWAVVDDSSNYALDENDWWTTVNTDQQDLYLFAHGLDYKAALADYMKVGGKIAMFPRYASGIWWTRWFNLDNADVRKVVADYQTRGLPLDVFVLDMDWHTKQGWGGYTFDRRLFPQPSDTMDFLHAQGLHTSANLHDDDGVRSSEHQYAAYAKALGLNPNSGATIPFNMINSTVAYALEDIVLGNVEKEGMDFWWIDWQQGGKQGGCAGGKQNPTIWLNHLRSTDNIRRGSPTRGLVLARWGGLGNHRYQVGFSGDVQVVNWPDLAFQPYFSLTAVNVGYGYWSHDIVGPYNSRELHTRWIQWGAFSGVFRTHDRGMSAGGCANNNPNDCGVVEMWNSPPKYFEANRAAVVARTELIPYIYTYTAKAYEAGVGLLRPMYYEFPTLDMAYAAAPNGNYSQYFFGESMWVNPVVVPMDTSNNMAQVTTWVPPGQWVEQGTGVIFNGSSTGNTKLVKNYDLTEIPIFVRAGAIVPGIPVVAGDTLGLAQRQYDSLVLSIYPGGESGSFDIYEDDGATTAYLKNAFAYTTAAYMRSNGVVTVNVSSKGSFPEMPTQRSYQIKLLNSLPALKVEADGQTIPYSRWGGPNTWHYCGTEMATIVTLSARAVDKGLSMTVALQTLSSGEDADSLLAGVKGAISHATLAKRNFDITRVTPGAHSVQGGNISLVASSCDSFSYFAGKSFSSFESELMGFRTLYKNARAEIAALQHSTTGVQQQSVSPRDNVESVNPVRKAYALALLDSVWVDTQ